MNTARPLYYRRVRLFCELKLHHVASVTGISASRIAAIEVGQRDANPTEQRILERFYRDKLAMVLEMDGPLPAWLREPSGLLEKREATHP
jgi:hypothetical protein